MNIAWRGHSIFMVRSNNINIIGLYVHNTQAWAIHPYMSSNLNFYNLYIKIILKCQQLMVLILIVQIILK